MNDKSRLLALKYWLAGTLLAVWGFLPGMLVHAQSTPPEAPPVEVVAKPLYLEWGITGAMIALAIFVVCRKSNRT